MLVVRPLSATVPKVLLFDVFGTCVEVRNSLIQQGENWSKEKNRRIAWAPLVDAWIEDHVVSIQRVRTGQQTWMTVDQIHERALKNFMLFRSYDVETITQFWHKLTPWPDATDGLSALKKNYAIAAFSNGNESLLRNLAQHANLPWDFIFSSEKSLHYKPDLEAYTYVATSLNLPVSDLMLVAAHPYDLQMAKRLGWKTAFVMRLGEYSGYTKTRALKEFDLVADDFIDLANQLTK